MPERPPQPHAATLNRQLSGWMRLFSPEGPAWERLGREASCLNAGSLGGAWSRTGSLTPKPVPSGPQLLSNWGVGSCWFARTLGGPGPGSWAPSGNLPALTQFWGVGGPEQMDSCPALPTWAQGPGSACSLGTLGLGGQVREGGSLGSGMRQASGASGSSHPAIEGNPREQTGEGWGQVGP